MINIIGNAIGGDLGPSEPILAIKSDPPDSEILKTDNGDILTMDE